MKYFLGLLLRYGYAVLFVAVFAQQCGAPVPADPFMIGMGALSGDGHYSFLMAVAIAWMAAMMADLVWFQIGRLWGTGALRLLCRISIEPDSCVARTRNRFTRGGPRTLLLAKFIPGLSAMATPVAGMIRTPLRQFLLWDGAGALLWVSLYLSLGYIFRSKLEALAELFAGVSKPAGILLVCAIAGYLAFKFYRRHRFLRNIASISVPATEVRDRLEREADVMTVDLRDHLEIAADPIGLPGAMRRLPQEVIERHAELPFDRAVILYCSCPNEGASGKTTLELRKLGYHNVRSLSGGLPAWCALGFPTENIVLESESPVRSAQA